MTEQEWLASTFSTSSLNFLKRSASERKLRLFACACCRTLWVAEKDGRIERAVDVAERYADGLTEADEVAEAREQANDASKQERVQRDYLYRVCGTLTLDADIRSAAFICAQYAPGAMPCEREEGVRRLGAICRDIFGNPFRPLARDPSWLTTDVLALARGAYDERAFDRMPILADALQDAGCANDDVLSHCRSEQTHVRGCWVVDLLLGKS